VDRLEHLLWAEKTTIEPVGRWPTSSIENLRTSEVRAAASPAR
jgi:hypothetical protein